MGKKSSNFILTGKLPQLPLVPRESFVKVGFTLSLGWMKKGKKVFEAFQKNKKAFHQFKVADKQGWLRPVSRTSQTVFFKIDLVLGFYLVI